MIALSFWVQQSCPCKSTALCGWCKLGHLPSRCAVVVPKTLVSVWDTVWSCFMGFIPPLAYHLSERFRTARTLRSLCVGIRGHCGNARAGKIQLQRTASLPTGLCIVFLLWLIGHIWLDLSFIATVCGGVCFPGCPGRFWAWDGSSSHCRKLRFCWTCLTRQVFFWLEKGSKMFRDCIVWSFLHGVRTEPSTGKLWSCL